MSLNKGQRFEKGSFKNNLMTLSVYRIEAWRDSQSEIELKLRPHLSRYLDKKSTESLKMFRHSSGMIPPLSLILYLLKHPRGL